MCNPQNTFCKRELSEAIDVRGWSGLQCGIGVNDLGLCSFQNHIHPSKDSASVLCDICNTVLRQKKVMPASQLIETVGAWCLCSWRKCNTSPYSGHFKAHAGQPKMGVAHVAVFESENVCSFVHRTEASKPRK